MYYNICCVILYKKKICCCVKLVLKYCRKDVRLIILFYSRGKLIMKLSKYLYVCN